MSWELNAKSISNCISPLSSKSLVTTRILGLGKTYSLCVLNQTILLFSFLIQFLLNLNKHLKHFQNNYFKTCSIFLNKTYLNMASIGRIMCNLSTTQTKFLFSLSFQTYKHFIIQYTHPFYTQNHLFKIFI